jgi:tRNA U34 5-methylaminomethyl-2-thiouridine-forming methyltransferase MnmC
VQSNSGYRLVKLKNGTHSVHSLAHGETFHPVIGPAAEAEALYVRQLALVDRLHNQGGEFVIWDVGLGSAANALTVLRATREIRSFVRLASFDATLEPLRFGLQQARSLGYFAGFEDAVQKLLTEHQVAFENSKQKVEWMLHVGDFPSLLTQPAAQSLPKPHVIMFDPYSPAKNPGMWTVTLFNRLFLLLDQTRPCALPTYSRSTMMRVALLVAGFYVGVGHPTGEKEETTIAANSTCLITEPLDRRWLERALRSGSAEPMRVPIYRQAPLSPETRETLRAHPQFM